MLLLSLTACPGDDSGAGTQTDGATETSTGTGDSGLDSTAGTDDSTGEPAGSSLQPCDPRLDDRDCDEGVCAGSPLGGYFCRSACSSMAEAGTPCGSDDICLPVDTGAEDTACFDVRDCDFVTGDGCPSGTGDSCVVVSLEPLRTACVPTGSTGLGETCDAVEILDCSAGAACLGSNLDEEIAGRCTGWCEPVSPLPADCPACAALNDEIGTCSECTALDDQCPEGTQCQLANELLGGVCVGIGPGGPGSPCSPADAAQSCQEGLLCIDLDGVSGDQPICIGACDPASPMCSVEGQSCLDVGLFVDGAPSGQLGVCAETDVQFCEPTAEPPGCRPGDNCLDLGGGVGLCGAQCDPALGGAACTDNQACFPSDGAELDVGPFVEGNGACGTGCATDIECGGETCLHLGGLATEGLCGATCTPGMPDTCAVGSVCVVTPEDPGVGACMVGGASCNPSNIGECGAAACIPLQGETLIGICAQSCFSQDPVACGGMPMQCISKTDPTWHEGTCVGGGKPCDPITNDCAPGQTCGVIGGQAFGGHAFICDDAGPLAEGDDCSEDNSACGAGMSCFGDACRAWCDPLAGACAVGACTDVSLSLYLPADTLGMCL